MNSHNLKGFVKGFEKVAIARYAVPIVGPILGGYRTAKETDDPISGIKAGLGAAGGQLVGSAAVALPAALALAAMTKGREKRLMDAFVDVLESKEPIMAIPKIVGAAGGSYLIGNRLHKKYMKEHEDGQKKTAAPAWFHEMNRTMNPLKSMKNFSTSGLKSMKAAKGIGKP